MELFSNSTLQLSWWQPGQVASILFKPIVNWQLELRRVAETASNISSGALSNLFLIVHQCQRLTLYFNSSHIHTNTHSLHPADSAGRWWRRVLRGRGHMCAGELTGVPHAAGWHHPQGANDWVTSSRWLRRLPSRCTADCFLTQPPLCDYCTYFRTALTPKNPDAAEPNSAPHKTVLSPQSESN